MATSVKTRTGYRSKTQKEMNRDTAKRAGKGGPTNKKYGGRKKK
jgi:hypothetical protein